MEEQGDRPSPAEKPRCLPCERVTAQRRRLIDLVNDRELMARLVSEVSALWGNQDPQIIGAALWEAGFASFPHVIPRYFALQLQTTGWRRQGPFAPPQAGDIFVVLGDRLRHSRCGVVAKHSTDGTWFRAFDASCWNGCTYRRQTVDADPVQRIDFFLRFG